MALSNYDRILFVSGTSFIYTSEPARTTFCNYLATNGFNGMYIADLDANNTGNYQYITELAISASSFGATTVAAPNTGPSEYFEIAAYLFDNANNPGYLQTSLLYDPFWTGSLQFGSWLTTQEAQIYDISSSFYIHNIVEGGDTLLTGYTEIAAMKAAITNTVTGIGEGYSQGVLLSIFGQGSPLYSYANNKKPVNILNRLDILAEAVSELRSEGVVSAGFKLPLRFYIHAGTISIGASEDYAGYSLAAAGTFDNFESNLIRTLVNRLTAHQRNYLDFQGFVYYKYPYAQSSVNPHSGTGSAAVVGGNHRILKINSAHNKLSGAARTDLMNHIQNHGYTWIQWYDLNTIMASNSLTASMALFISEARSYGTVSRVGAIRSTSTTKWQEVFDYNLVHPWYEQFDDFNIEGEFWQYGADPDAPKFSEWSSSGVWLRNQLDSPTYNRGAAYTASGGNAWIISGYLTNYSGTPLNNGGYPLYWVQPYVTASILADIIDVYEATNYRTSPGGTVVRDYQLALIASASYELGVTTSFVPLWSAEKISWGGAGNFMGSYIRTNGLTATEAAWDSYAAGWTFDHLSNITQSGYNYFSHKYMSISLETTIP